MQIPGMSDNRRIIALVVNNALTTTGPNPLECVYLYVRCERGIPKICAVGLARQTQKCHILRIFPGCMSEWQPSRPEIQAEIKTSLILLGSQVQTGGNGILLIFGIWLSI